MVFVMPSEETKILLEFNQYQNSDKAPYFIHQDSEYLINWRM